MALCQGAALHYVDGRHGVKDHQPAGPTSTSSAGAHRFSIPLRTGQRVQPIEHRRAQLMQPGERQLHLRLDAGDPDDPTPGHQAEDVLQ
jgi:hypothetical protein